MQKINHRRKNFIRLKDFDYRTRCAYFTTICTNNKSHLLAFEHNSRMILTDIGILAKRNWFAIANTYDNVIIDSFVIMPNHIHGIIHIASGNNTLGNIIGSFKSATTRSAKGYNLTNSQTIWQRGYHDHIIRSYQSLHRIRNYIDNNSNEWIHGKKYCS